MKVLVCGGRDYKDFEKVFTVLDQYPITHIVHGDCKTGADAFAKEYALVRSLCECAEPAKWYINGKLDRSAGPKRNSKMLLDHPDIVFGIAFPGGRGTADMVKKMKAKGIPVHEVV